MKSDKFPCEYEEMVSGELRYTNIENIKTLTGSVNLKCNIIYKLFENIVSSTRSKIAIPVYYAQPENLSINGDYSKEISHT